MTTVLLVEDDPFFRSLTLKILQQMEGVTPEVVGSAKEATRRLRERGVSVLLTDLRLGDGDGLDLIEALPELSPETVPILMSGVASPRDYQNALRLGAVEVLIKPFVRDALVSAVRRALDSGSGFRGSVHGLSLIDLLQMFHLARRSLVLEVQGPRRRGSLVFREGELIHAEEGRRRGEEALAALLALGSGSMHTAAYRPTEPTIQGNFQGVLMDALRVIDEQGGAPASVPAPRGSRASSSIDNLPPLPRPSSSSIEAMPAVRRPPSETGAPPAVASGPTAAPEALPDDLATLMGFAGSLDAELGVAVRRQGKLMPLLSGSLPQDAWPVLDRQATWLIERALPGWSRLFWIAGSLGLALFDWTARDTQVLLSQRFVGSLDDRRFRWNATCVARFLTEETGEVTS